MNTVSTITRTHGPNLRHVCIGLDGEINHFLGRNRQGIQWIHRSLWAHLLDADTAATLFPHGNDVETATVIGVVWRELTCHEVSPQFLMRG